jgi:hypothetical protein
VVLLAAHRLGHRPDDTRVVLFFFEGKGPLGKEWEERKTKEMMEKEEAEVRASTHRVA